MLALLTVGSTSLATTPSDGSNKQKAVLVTGASTGIGRHVTEAMAAEGYFVYAGARKQKDLDALNAIPNVQGVRLDVTIQEEVDAAVETVRKGGRGLYGLVNNAGVVSGGPLIEMDRGMTFAGCSMSMYLAYSKSHKHSRHLLSRARDVSRLLDQSPG